MRDNDAIAADGLRRALAAVDGNQSQLARICGCTQGAIWQMLNRSNPRLSARFALKVEEALGIPCHELRPDYYPAPSKQDA